MNVSNSNNLEMNKICFLFLCLSLLLPKYLLFGQIQVDSTRIVKVLSFNILHGATTKGDFDLDVIAKVIIDANPI
jgi:hypothetical protein